MTSVLIDQTIRRGLDQAPQAPAIICDQETVSYAELWERAEKLASFLRKMGVQRGDRVALFLPKGIEAVVAVYGVLLSEAIYVPLDVRSPVKRLQTILNDAVCQVILSTSSLATITTELREGSISRPGLIHLSQGTVVEEAGADAGRDERDFRFDGDTTDTLAAILYTSGSTGVPKGVVLTQAGLLHFASWTGEFFGLTARDRIASIASLQFDLATFDLFATHQAGAAVVLPGERTLLFPQTIVPFFERHGVTVCYSVPTFWMLLEERGGLVLGRMLELRHVMFAGEVFPLPALRRLMQILPLARFTNLFGPLETNVCSLQMLSGIPADDATEISIGKACPETVLHVLGDEGTEVGPGEVGELIVQGPSVTPGYWRNVELTEQKRWRQDPRSFRTGDLVCYGSTGELLFRGRRDHQVKLNGYRIELHEIEQILQRHTDVAQAVVLLCSPSVGRNRLVAVVVRRKEVVSCEALLEFAATHLPQWSHPGRVVFRERLPTTVTGKIDRCQLQADVEANNGT
ncbi:MAG: amino acid adenylation domain-containing protein [Planctomycetota bacterium]